MELPSYLASALCPEGHRAHRHLCPGRCCLHPQLLPAGGKHLLRRGGVKALGLHRGMQNRPCSRQRQRSGTPSRPVVTMATTHRGRNSSASRSPDAMQGQAVPACSQRMPRLSHKHVSSVLSFRDHPGRAELFTEKRPSSCAGKGQTLGRRAEAALPWLSIKLP